MVPLWVWFVGFLVAALGLLLYSILSVAKTEDRAGRHSTKALLPDSDVTITRGGKL